MAGSARGVLERAPGCRHGPRRGHGRRAIGERRRRLGGPRHLRLRPHRGQRRHDLFRRFRFGGRDPPDHQRRWSAVGHATRRPSGVDEFSQGWRTDQRRWPADAERFPAESTGDRGQGGLLVDRGGRRRLGRDRVVCQTQRPHAATLYLRPDQRVVLVACHPGRVRDGGRARQSRHELDSDERQPAVRVFGQRPGPLHRRQHRRGGLRWHLPRRPRRRHRHPPARRHRHRHRGGRADLGQHRHDPAPGRRLIRQRRRHRRRHV